MLLCLTYFHQMRAFHILNITSMGGTITKRGYLGDEVYMHLDLQLSNELMLQVDDVLGPSDTRPKGMYASPMDVWLRASILRFLEAMSTVLRRYSDRCWCGKSITAS